MQINRINMLGIACASALGFTAVGARAGTVTDDFSTSRDYLTDGVSGTIWDGIHNQSAANLLNTTGTAGQLTIGTPSSAVGWDGTHTNAPFLYRNVAGDFDARVQVTAGTTPNYTIAGLLVRLDPASADGNAGEDFVMLTRNWGSTIAGNQLRSVNDNTQSDSGILTPAQAYLRLTRTGNVFRGYFSSDGITWTQRAWGSGSTDLTRTDLTGTVQVGLTEGAFSAGNVTWVRFDNFTLSTPGLGDYAFWAAAQGLTGTAGDGSNVDPAFAADPNADGIQNGLAWILGADALGNPAANRLKLPAISWDGTGTLNLMTFDRLNASAASAPLAVQYADHLVGAGWTTTMVGTNAGATTDGNISIAVAPGGGSSAEYDRINVTVLATYMAAHSSMFARLKVMFPETNAPPPIDSATLAQWSAPYRNWYYQPHHVISSTPNIPGYESFQGTDVPTVFQLPGDTKWYMTFIAFDGGGYQSFIAESTDLVNWTNRRLAMPFGPAGAFDYGGVVLGAYLYESYDIKARRTLKLKDGKFWSLYGAYDSRSGYEAGVGANGLASSGDGVNWTRFQNQPVLSIYDPDRGAWENTVIYQPWLVEHQGMFYNHYNAKGGPEQIGTATSSDLLSWTRYANNPVIPVGASIYNTSFSADLKIFWDRDHWVGFFFGVGAGGAHIMAAFSRDLYNWTVDPVPLYLAGGNPSGLDSSYAHKISLVWNPANETFYMYYNAVGNAGRGIGLITSKPLPSN